MGGIRDFGGKFLGKLRSGPVCRLRRRSVVVATLLQVCVASLRSARLINAFGDEETSSRREFILVGALASQHAGKVSRSLKAEFFGKNLEILTCLENFGIF